jgi:hypothetical protein
MTIKEFKNGNFNLKYTKEEQFSFDFNEYNLMREFYYILENLMEFDFMAIGNFECIGNDDIMIRFYNERLQKAYIMVINSDVSKLITGETVKLIGHNLDDHEKELLQEENE